MMVTKKYTSAFKHYTCIFTFSLGLNPYFSLNALITSICFLVKNLRVSYIL